MRSVSATGINGDLTSFCAVDTREMDWAPSPSGTVWRKRVHLVGAAESGQVTSIVRYDRDSRFPAHGHPGGEEILVLDGVFSDQQGDWPAGTFLLNPEGFRHAPFSRNGCVLLVKLRQYPGADRRHVAINTNAVPWQPGELPGLHRKLLYRQDGYSDRVELQKWEPGAEPGMIEYPEGAELFVVSGGLRNEHGRFGAGCWLRLPVRSSHRLVSDSGCVLYLKTGGLKYLVPSP